MQPVAPSSFPAPPRSTESPTWWWFIIPAVSLGFGSFVTVFLGAWRLKSRPHMCAAAGYLITDVVYCISAGLLAPAKDADPNASINGDLAVAVIIFLAIAWIGGTLHTVFLQLLVAKSVAGLVAQPPLTHHSPDPAVAAAMWRAGRRAEARDLLRTDPGMAWELRIGRPDLEGRQYDDGGLVDVNHLSAAWLAYALQIPQPIADEIVAARTRHQGFSSPDELIIYCQGMTPDRLAMVRDFLVIRPL